MHSTTPTSLPTLGNLGNQSVRWLLTLVEMSWEKFAIPFFIGIFPTTLYVIWESFKFSNWKYMGMMRARSSGAVLLFKKKERKKAGMMRARCSGAVLLFRKKERKKAEQYLSHYIIELLPTGNIFYLSLSLSNLKLLNVNFFFCFCLGWWLWYRDSFVRIPDINSPKRKESGSVTAFQ